jgi:hypothetical protein
MLEPIWAKPNHAAGMPPVFSTASILFISQPYALKHRALLTECIIFVSAATKPILKVLVVFIA